MSLILTCSHISKEQSRVWWWVHIVFLSRDEGGGGQEEGGETCHSAHVDLLWIDLLRCGQDDIKTGTDWGWIISQFSRNQSSWRDTEALAAHMLCSLIVNIPDIWSPEPGTSADQGRRRRVPVSWILTQVAEYCLFYHLTVQLCRCVSYLTKHMQILNIWINEILYRVYSIIISIYTSATFDSSVRELSGSPAQ